jgi:hypothetical protein
MSAEEPHRITRLGRSPGEDRAHRQRAYLISMSLRAACFLAAIFLPAPMAVRIAFCAGAILLPYFAVVVANAARVRDQGPTADLGTFRAGHSQIES